MRVLARSREALHTEVPLNLLLRAPTVAGIARHLELARQLQSPLESEADVGEFDEGVL